MRLNWKGQGRKVNGNLVLDWYLTNHGNRVFISKYVVWNHKTGRTILTVVVQ